MFGGTVERVKRFSHLVQWGIRQQVHCFLPCVGSADPPGLPAGMADYQRVDSPKELKTSNRIFLQIPSTEGGWYGLAREGEFGTLQASESGSRLFMHR